MTHKQLFFYSTANATPTFGPELEFGIIIGVLMVTFAIIALLVRNPVLAVISLVFVFCNASMMLLLLELEFLGFSLLVIYVGGLAVLFLSACMFINLRHVDLGNWIVRYLPVAVALTAVILMELLTIIIKLYHTSLIAPLNSIMLSNVINIKLIAFSLFYYKFSFPIIGGAILLCAVAGALTLALHRRQQG
jgi:NADH-quinone oxidoreductase subunit J